MKIIHASVVKVSIRARCDIENIFIAHRKETIKSSFGMENTKKGRESRNKPVA